MRRAIGATRPAGAAPAAIATGASDAPAGGRAQQEKQARSLMHAGQNDAPLLIRP